MKLNRRGFVLSAASVAALPLVTRSGVSTAYAADMSLLMDADMEVDDFSQYENFGDSSHLRLVSSGNSPTISTDRARAGSRSMRVYLNRQSSASSYRTEATATGAQKSLEFRKTYWIGFSIYVPSNWAISSITEVLFQLHHIPPEWGKQFGFSPILALRCPPGSDQCHIQQDYVQTPEELQQQSDLKRAFFEPHGTIARGEWTDWVLEYRPDWRSLTDGGIGVTRVWRNGVKLVNYTGPNCVNGTRGPYIKFGCYKGGWQDASKADTVNERLYYFDEFRVSRPDQGSYEVVAPGGTESARPMAPESFEVS